jgi:hypothetical protein
MSLEDVRKINLKLQIDTISRLLFILIPFGLLEAFTNTHILFNGKFGLPTFASLDQSLTNGRTLLTFGQANAAAMMLTTFYVVILYDSVILKNKSYLRYLILILTTLVLFSTGSRSGTLAILLATTWVIVMAITNGKPVGVFLILIPSTYLVFASFLFNVFSKLSTFGFGRTDSEAQLNWEVRKTILQNTAVFDDLPFLGVGNGNAQKYYALTGNGFILENSAYQVLIGFGFFLGIILISIWLYLLITSVSMSSISLFIPVTFFFISSNAWEGNRYIQVLLGVLVCMARIADANKKTSLGDKNWPI